MPERNPQFSLRVGKPAAPGALSLLEGFLNTQSTEMDIEDFATAKSTDEWLREVGLWTGTRLTSKQHRAILDFRDALRAWILDHEQYRALNTLLATTTFQAKFGTSGDVQFHPRGEAGVLSALIELISDSQYNGTWDRFKCCELPTCGWAFYDSTRSRTKRWCSMNTCGSRHKAREYYKRQRER